MKNASHMRKKTVRERIKVWDAPTRLFHWSVVCLVAASWFTADQSYMKAHLWSGLMLLALLLFRIVWGFLGSTTARFRNFLHSPSKVFSYIKAIVRHEKQLHAGHNPAGGLMVITLLTILLTQVVTGLFANDGGQFHGPLALQISSSASDQFSQLHRWLFNGILFLIWTHLVAIFFYLCVKRENLIGSMVTGYKSLEDLPPKLRLKFTNSAVALAILATVSGLVAYGLL